MKYLSWQTSAAGISAIVIAIFQMIIQPLTDGNPATNPDYNVAIASILTGVGLLRARDNDKTSEEIIAGKSPTKQMEELNK